MKNLDSKRRILIYIIIGISIILLINIIKFDGTVGVENFNELAIYSLNENDVITTSFIMDADEFDNLGMKVATYCSSNIKGTIHVILKDETSNNLILDSNINTKDFIDNSLYKFDIKKQKNIKNHEFLLTMEVLELDSDEKIGIYGPSTLNSSTFINSQQTNHSIGLIYNYRKADNSLYIYLLFYVLIIILMEILNIKERGRY
jgi:hypothetical protein